MKMSILCITRFYTTPYDSPTISIRRQRVFSSLYALLVPDLIICSCSIEIPRKDWETLVPKRSNLIHSLQALTGKSCWRREYSRHSSRQWYVLQDCVSLIWRIQQLTHRILIKNSHLKRLLIALSMILNYLKQCNYSFKDGHTREGARTESEQA